MFVSFLTLITFTAFAQKLIVSPPYPDVWGYDLSSLPAVKWGFTDVDGYLMDDGDVWFLVTHSYKESFKKDLSEDHSDYKYLLIKFFTGEKIELSENQRKKVFGIINKHHVLFQSCYSKDHSFKDGYKLRFSPSIKAKCFSPAFDNQYFVITDPKGHERKYVVFVGCPQVEIICTPGFTDSPSGPFYYQKINILTKIIPLKDDTFIVSPVQL